MIGELRQFDSIVIEVGNYGSQNINHILEIG